MRTDDEKSLELLKQLFLDESNQKQEEFEKELSILKFQITNKEAKIDAYYPIVTDLLRRKITDSEEEVAEVLSPLMGNAIKKQVVESKDDIVDALYPIMGAAIKRSVSEGIKEIYESLNLKIDKALRRGIFSKQIKSKISGVSTADLILQESFPFRIKEMFLIHEESGILISHVSSTDSMTTTDGDIISGMLSAIKDFVSESFKSDSGTQNLYEIQYGDSKIVLERGLYSYLAIVISGTEPIEFHSDLTDFNGSIYKNYHKKLRQFDGNTSKLSKLNATLKEFIHKYQYVSSADSEVKPTPILLYLFLTLLALIFIIWGSIKLPKYFEEKSKDKIILNKLVSIPNIKIDDIKWSHSGEKVVLSGIVGSYHERNIIDSTINSIPEVGNLDNQLGVIFKSFSMEKIIEEINRKLRNIASDKITYQVVDDQVVVEGEVETEDDKIKIGYQLAQVSGIRIIINNLKVADQNELTYNDLKEILNNLKLNYDFGQSEVTQHHSLQLVRIASLLKKYDEFFITVKGFADGLVTESNLRKAKERAENIVDYLVSQGISRERMETSNFISSSSNSTDGSSLRRVELELLREY